MGAGLSSSLQQHVLRGWEAECQAPGDIENTARLLARFAFTLAEVHPPAHRGGERIAQSSTKRITGVQSGTGSLPGPRLKRPVWLEPSLLHILLISSSPNLASAVLDGLRAVSPLATIVEDSLERDGGAFAAAKKAGFGSYAFVDAELRVLRLWTVSESAILADAGVCEHPSHTANGTARLPFFDLSVWLVDDAESEEGPAPLLASGHSAATPARENRVALEHRAALVRDLEEAKAAKQAAIKAEDFEKAQLWKVREREREAKLQEAEASLSAAAAEGTNHARKAEEQQLQDALDKARAAKRAAVEAEDFKGAQNWKDKERNLEAALSALISDAAASTIITPDTPDTPDTGKWKDRVRALTGGGRPPLLIVGSPGVPRELRCETLRAGLPQNCTWALRKMSPGQRPGLGAEPGFWNVVQAAVQLVKTNRDFPTEIPSIHLGSDVKLGVLVRLRNLEPMEGSPESEEQVFNGHCGTVVGCSGQYFLVRLWDGEIVRALREQLTVISFKLGASSPVQLNNMELMRVRLRNLKSKPELNGREGEAEDPAVDGRYTVSLTGGGSIKAKADNIEVTEPASRELQGRLGLVDTRDAVRARYKVLLVKTTDRTEERSHVRLRDLRARPELNGQKATIENFNPRTERFTIRLGSDNGEIAIKRQNFEFLQPVRIEAMALSLRPDCVDYFLDPDLENELFEK